MKFVINNTEDLDVSSNEYRTNYTVLRIINRLFENDKVLRSLYNEVFATFQIYEWEYGVEYSFGDVVWFLDINKELHVLRCDVNTSKSDLNLVVSSKQSFTSLGWKDLNPDIDIMQEYGLLKKIDNYVMTIFKNHLNDKNLHKFGRLSYDDITSKNSIDRKIAKRDLTNLDPNREEVFFPYLTITFSTTKNNAIMSGYCRRYDNGLLEYDIIFRLGYLGYEEIDHEYKISADAFKCNDLDLRSIHSMDKYFNLTSDMNIFFLNSTKSRYESEIGYTVQRNRNDFVNTYSAVLNFALAAAGLGRSSLLFEFSNTDYMVFCSNLMSQNRNTKNNMLNPSPNSITFCKKENGSVTALLVTYPNASNFTKEGNNSLNTGLLANSFHCHIIGQGKVL